MIERVRVIEENERKVKERTMKNKNFHALNKLRCLKSNRWKLLIFN